MKLLIIGGGAIADCNHIPSAKKLLDMREEAIISLEKDSKEIEVLL